MIKVIFDESEFRRIFDDMIEKQIPFATSLAINRTAYDARDELRGALGKHFTMRSKWTRKGIRIEKSSKKQFPNIQAHVGSVDEYMRRQAEGGAKTPGSAGYVAIPSRKVRGGGKRKTLPSKWPGALIKKDRRRKVRKLSTKPGSSGNILLFQQKGGRKNPRFDLLYVLARSVQVPRRWPINDTVEDVVARRWPVQMKRALAKAIKSARS